MKLKRKLVLPLMTIALAFVAIIIFFAVTRTTHAKPAIAIGNSSGGIYACSTTSSSAEVVTLVSDMYTRDDFDVGSNIAYEESVRVNKPKSNIKIRSDTFILPSQRILKPLDLIRIPASVNGKTDKQRGLPRIRDQSCDFERTLTVYI